ncbi:hypothetical protein [Bacillus toyonensis]|uniref:TFIIB-type zinc ribbon-containing protein n=1 Tax=Bacillus toyonensis TaxID=155322 RepID=A0A2B5CSI1_9BACI|nr:hypothetical protein [Bacillus toyonensis]PEJ86178.1 hypothetical protein CN688_29310 [Bacillus toyonensis]PEK89793.1 hypothetical protein CN594_03505 [Bacillus toyonensis]PEL26227.1 hypothetical protein CN624_14140 [Bacillus toyonensis]PEO54181.1 hypothetical protein CN579_23265 [Bacillus toyonensis]PFY36195.1 hypothetical protein COL54_26875 [Bacillus toyonensis]
MKLDISIPTDSQGFYSLECPYCHERFKAQAGDIDSEEILELYCPSCGLVADNSEFISSEVVKHAMTLAMNYVQNEIFNSLSKTSKKIKGSGLSMSVNKPKEEVPQLLTEDENLEQVELNCCDKIIKVYEDQKVTNIYCPFCGVN